MCAAMKPLPPLSDLVSLFDTCALLDSTYQSLELSPSCLLNRCIVEYLSIYLMSSIHLQFNALPS